MSDPVTVALDLLGGDGAPGVVVDGALLALAADPALSVTLVGPPEVAERELAMRSSAPSSRLCVAPASQAIMMAEDPARAVRAKRDATVRVAARLVRDGLADATVSVGSTGAAMAAALFTLGRLPGVARPALAVVVDAWHSPVILLDAGATTEASTTLLAQYALAGAAFATARLGLPRPRVGLLSIGAEERKGDELRKAAYDAMAALPIDFIGNVEAGDVPYGGRVDVVVTDGFTGNVLIKGLEGALGMLREVLIAAFTTTRQRREAAKVLLPVLAEATDHMRPESTGGGMLLGVRGVVVIGHGASPPTEVAACVAVAAQAVRRGMLLQAEAALADLLARGRDVAALPTAAGSLP